MRRSFEPGFRPGMGAEPKPLRPGEPFINFADNVLCIGTQNGQFKTYSLTPVA
jgi:hypothetical protein